MKNITVLILLCSMTLVSCAQKNQSRDKSTPAPSFDLTLDKAFYMTGDATDDLYITATINSGKLQAPATIYICKKNNVAEKVQATIYRIDDKKFHQKDAANAGEEVIIYLKVNNDRKFSLGYNGDQYLVQNAGHTSPPVATSSPENKAVVTIDGKPWAYTYVKVYHYTRDDGKGVTKGRANIMLTFTRPNTNMKTQPEESLQVNIYTAAQAAGTYKASQLDVAWMGEWNGKEITLLNNSLPDQPAEAVITAYTSGNTPLISGRIYSNARQMMCGGCGYKKIEINFENLPVEVYAK